MNYFDLFNLPVHFKVSQGALSKRYITLQKQYHPDYYSQAEEEDRAFALEHSSLINKAYRTFRNPDATMKYILELKGLLQDGEQYQLTPDFLMEVMELNELKMDGEDPETITRRASQLQQEIYEEIAAIVEGYNDEITTEAELAKVKDYFYKKKYLDRLLAE